MKTIFCCLTSIFNCFVFNPQAIADLINEGDLVIADRAGTVIKVDPNDGTQLVISTGGFLVKPVGATIDHSGDILVTDIDAFGSGGVIRIDRITGAQSEISSGGVFVTPAGIEVDANGDLIVTDDRGGLSGLVVRVDPVTGSQSIISSGNVLVDPGGLVLNQQGNIVIAEGTGGGSGFNGSIVVVDPQSGSQSILSVGGHLVSPRDVSADESGELYFTEPGVLKIVHVDPVSGAQTLISSGGLLVEPSEIEIDANGDLLVADGTQVLRIDPLTGGQAVVSSGGNLVRATGLAIVPDDPSATYFCVGFLPPADSGPITVKKNRAVPLKAELYDADGFEVTDVDINSVPVIQVLFLSAQGGDPIDVTDDALPAGASSEGNMLTFTANHWRYNLSTSNYSAPGTYLVSIDSGDPSDYQIDPTCEVAFVIE